MYPNVCGVRIDVPRCGVGTDTSWYMDRNRCTLMSVVKVCMYSDVVM